MTETSALADYPTCAPGATTRRALERISVRPPYFALTDIEEAGPGLVCATVPDAPAMGAERGPFAASQVARHLAILGSCAAALGRDDDRQHHYLATSAHFTRTAGASRLGPSGPTTATASATWVDKRTVRAFVQQVGPEGEGLYWLDATYAVLTPRMFARLHPPVEPGSLGEDPQRGLSLDNIEPTATGVRIDCGIIPADMCAGHFDGFPAAPVAVVMGHLGAAASLALGSRLGRIISYRVEEAQVKADRLGRAGQRLELEAEYIAPVGADHMIQGRAAADGNTIGEMIVTLSAGDAL